MLIFAGFLLGAFALSPLWKDKRFKNLYLIIIFLALVFITGFRSMSYYTDTEAYYSFYQQSAKTELSVLFRRIFEAGAKDPFYHFCTSLMAHIGLDFRAWMVIVSLIYYGGFIYVVKRFSKVPFVAVLGLTALSYVFFTMTGIRQTIAMGFTFFAFVKAYDKKLISFLIFVFFGFLFHSSALIFLLSYPLMRAKLGWLQISMVLGAILMALLFPGAINTIVRELAWNEDLAAYADTTTGLSIAGYVIQLMIIIAGFFLAGKGYFETKEGLAFINMLILGLVFQTFVVRIDNIFRLSMYFSVYGVIFIGNTTANQKLLGKKEYNVAYMLVAISFIAYMIYSRSFANFTMFGGV